MMSDIVGQILFLALSFISLFTAALIIIRVLEMIAIFVFLKYKTTVDNDLDRAKKAMHGFIKNLRHEIDKNNLQKAEEIVFQIDGLIEKYGFDLIKFGISFPEFNEIKSIINTGLVLMIPIV